MQFPSRTVIWHTRANLLTVLAVLMVLPGAKRIVALIAAGKKKSVSSERCHRIEAASGEYQYAGDIDLHDYEPEDDDEDEDDETQKDTYRDGDEPVIPWNILFTDYIFTSPERVMMLEFMVVTDRKVFILMSPSERDREYVKKYLTDTIRKVSGSFEIIYVADDDDLVKKLDGLETGRKAVRGRLELLKTLKSLAM